MFCFSWVLIGGRRHEENHLGDFEKQLSECDGHALFSNTALPAHDIIVLASPTHPWGYNMGNLLACWEYLLTKLAMGAYDWVLNVERDSLFYAPHVRTMIARHVEVLPAASQGRRADQATMLGWGNVYLFSRAMVREMRRQWAVLGDLLPTNSTSNGCPRWKIGLNDWPRCVQDNDYWLMARRTMSPAPVSSGIERCNRVFCMSRVPKGKQCPRGKLHMMCITFTATAFTTPKRQVQLLEAIAEGRAHKLAAELLGGPSPPWWLREVDLRQIPFYNGVYDPAVRALSQKLWGHARGPTLA